MESINYAFPRNNYIDGIELEKTQLFEIFESKNLNKLNYVVHNDENFRENNKFMLLLLSIIWEEKSVINFLFQKFSHEYSKEFKWTNDALINQIYTKNQIKIYEKAFIEGLINQEFDLLREIYGGKDCQIAFTFELVSAILKKLPYYLINEIIKLCLFYIAEYSISFNKVFNKIELDTREMLKIICKTHKPLNFIYKFIYENCNIDSTINILIELKMNRLAQIFINQVNSGNANIVQFLNIAVKYKNYKLLLMNYNSLKNVKFLTPDLGKMINHLIYNFDQSKIYIDLQIILISEFAKFLTYNQSQYIVMKFGFLITSKDKEINFLLFVTNPVKTLLMIFEILHFIKGRYSTLSSFCRKISETIISFILFTLESQQNHYDVYFILEDKIFKKGKVIDYICKYKLLEILKNPFVTLYIQKSFDNAKNKRISFLDLSTPFKIIKEGCLYNPLFDFTKYFTFKTSYIKGSIIDFMRNPSTKYYYNFLFQIIIAIVVFAYILILNSNMEITIKSLLDLQNSLKPFKEDVFICNLI